MGLGLVWSDGVEGKPGRGQVRQGTIYDVTKMETYKVVIKGTEPMLMHAPTAIGGPKTVKPTEYDPQVEAEKVLYKNGNGIFVPAMWILATLRDAGKQHTIPGRGKRNYSKALVGSIRINPTEIVLKYDGKWEVDARPVKVGPSRVMRWRPKFSTGWSCEFTIINKDPAVTTKGAIKRILADAGRFNGIGDMRPYFGLFEVMSFVDLSSGKEVES